MPTIIKPIRSFVHRERRLIQKTFPQVLWEKYGSNMENPQKLIDFFNQFSSLTLEIGFGTGDTLCEQAEKNLKQGYIGIEVYKTGIKKLLFKLEQATLNNIRLLEGDAVQLLSKNTMHNRFNTIQILFPDPWPKSRHHKRRLIQADFLSLLYQTLQSNGLLYLATDCEHYAYQMLAHLEASPFVNAAKDGTFVDKPSTIPLTKFEKRGKQLGHGIFYLAFRKCV